MKTYWAVLAGSLLAWMLMGQDAGAALDREKLLKDPGVYGTFAVFKVDEDWWKLEKAARTSAVSEVKAVFQKHADHVITDTYLLRGLSERADFFVRVHATEMLNNQNFLVDVMGTSLGKHLHNTHTFNGLTKPLNYVPGFPEDVKTALKTPPDPGAKPYVIVVPVRKDAEWWAMSQDARGAMMKEHTDATVAYLKTVKRKLYHASGLDDLDFITYFETAKLDDFNNLIIGLERVKENKHNKQFGSPTLLGTIRPLDEIMEILSR
ncbi:MAG: chlorite dismutase family protein [Nitrospirae bacterium]|nr:MAG: chlorite dismutase family protein [Nitrospirota bacterium]TLY44212.1 MAG: chlorite dismutase family protein [Nitrospirota bacterium]